MRANSFFLTLPRVSLYNSHIYQSFADQSSIGMRPPGQIATGFTVSKALPFNCSCRYFCLCEIVLHPPNILHVLTEKSHNTIRVT